MQEKKVQLLRPLLVDGKEINEVTLRRPKTREFKAVAHIDNMIDKEMMLISICGNLNATIEEMEEWDGPTFLQLSEAMGSFQKADTKK